MRRLRDVSPAVRELAYCDETRTLDVVWASGDGRAYRFFEVPPEVFAWLLNQKSVGGFIRRKIIGTYRETRLTRDGVEASTDEADLAETLEASIVAVGTKPPPDGDA